MLLGAAPNRKSCRRPRRCRGGWRRLGDTSHLPTEEQEEQEQEEDWRQETHSHPTSEILRLLRTVHHTGAHLPPLARPLAPQRKRELGIEAELPKQ